MDLDLSKAGRAAWKTGRVTTHPYSMPKGFAISHQDQAGVYEAGQKAPKGCLSLGAEGVES